MNCRELRKTVRINYKELADSGEKVPIAEAEAPVATDELIDSLVDGIYSLSFDDVTIYESSCETSLIDPDSNPIVSRMGDVRLNQLIAELESLLFQVEEISETVDDDLAVLRYENIVKLHDELKDLRITMTPRN